MNQLLSLKSRNRREKKKKPTAPTPSATQATNPNRPQHPSYTYKQLQEKHSSNQKGTQTCVIETTCKKKGYQADTMSTKIIQNATTK